MAQSGAPILAAGHICLDLIPRLGPGAEFRPGVLYEAGSCSLSTGGAVANVGLSLHRLGRPVRLAGKVGCDPFGRLVKDLLEGCGAGLGDAIVASPEAETSYSIVLSPPGRDRVFLHCPGANAGFASSDVTDRELHGARHLHFGYPPLMKAMSQNDGAELLDLMTRAKEAGLTTSLDMSLPDPSSAARDVDWSRLLDRVLPWVDLFVPSLDEIALMLPSCPPDAQSLAEECVRRGAGTAFIKKGRQGAWASGGGGERLEQAPCLSPEWRGASLSQACFAVDEVGTTGSGDATIAGFLDAALDGRSPRECLRWACAVGACCVEAADAISGIRPRAAIEARIAQGWPLRSEAPA